MFFVLTRHKTVLETIFSGAVPQHNLGSWLLSYSLQFGSNKTLAIPITQFVIVY